MTKNNVKWFEREQKEFGTEAALTNLILSICSDLMTDCGVTSIHVDYKEKK